MKRAAPAAGFTYLGLLILLAVLGLVGAAGLKMGTLLQRAAAEEELLEIGAQFQEALRSYAAATPPGQKPQPATLQDLLKDPRFPNVRRHLRKIFVDPVTGKAEWGIIYLGDPIAVNAGNSVNALGAIPAPSPMAAGEKVGVIGVYSLSEAPPLKIANFDIRFQNMENRQKISEWKFVLTGGEGGNPPVNTPANSMTGEAPPPSLFPQPGAGGKPGDAVAGAGAPGGKGATPPNPGQGIKPTEPSPPPPVPEQPDAPAAEELAQAEEPEPVQSDAGKAAEENAAEEKEREQEGSSSSDPKAAPPQGTVAPPPPEMRGGRRR